MGGPRVLAPTASICTSFSPSPTIVGLPEPTCRVFQTERSLQNFIVVLDLQELMECAQSLYTGVYARGGPSVEESSSIDLPHYLDRSEVRQLLH